jgi:hypothetical protein
MDEESFDFENLKVYQRALEYRDFCLELSKMITGLMKFLKEI